MVNDGDDEVVRTAKPRPPRPRIKFIFTLSFTSAPPTFSDAQRSPRRVSGSPLLRTTISLVNMLNMLNIVRNLSVKQLQLLLKVYVAMYEAAQTPATFMHPFGGIRRRPWEYLNCKVLLHVNVSNVDKHSSIPGRSMSGSITRTQSVCVGANQASC